MQRFSATTDAPAGTRTSAAGAMVIINELATHFTIAKLTRCKATQEQGVVGTTWRYGDRSTARSSDDLNRGAVDEGMKE